jgi:hypothetical protein
MDGSGTKKKSTNGKINKRKRQKLKQVKSRAVNLFYMPLSVSKNGGKGKQKDMAGGHSYPDWVIILQPLRGDRFRLDWPYVQKFLLEFNQGKPHDLIRMKNTTANREVCLEIGLHPDEVKRVR